MMMRRMTLLLLWFVASTMATTSAASPERDGQQQQQQQQQQERDTDDKLPEDFIVGAGTSAYQCEGAWNASGKGEGLIDRLLHGPWSHVFTANGDVAADSYHRYREDVAAARALKLQMYRFSLSWPRLQPTGRADLLNPDGLRYYNDLIDELDASGIQPMVTLFHFEYPVTLYEEFGGWADDRMIDAFVQFAEMAFTHFGDRVRWWTTFNEPYMFCAWMPGPSTNKHSQQANKAAPPPPPPPPPRKFNSSSDSSSDSSSNSSRSSDAAATDYGCIHRVVLAHARVYALYKERFAHTQKGKVGLSNFSFAPRPNSTAYADVAAARRYNQFTMGVTFGPLVTGQYPPEVRRGVDEASRLEGRTESRLPRFTQQQSDMVRGSLDFVGVNMYYAQVVARGTRPRVGSLMTDHAVRVLSGDINIRDPVRAFQEFTPWGLRETVSWLWDEYHLPVFVTENGYVAKSDEQEKGSSSGAATGGRDLRDRARAVYHSAHLRELMLAVREDGVPVLGYLAWSLIDVFEWISMYSYTFGLVRVDYTGGSLDRTLKESSSAFFTRLADTRRVPLVLPPPVHAAASADAATICRCPTLLLAASIQMLLLVLGVLRP